MNLLADEGIDRQIIDALRKQGYSVGYIAEMDPGISDNDVLELANRERCLLLSADKDFGELVFRLHRLSTGVVLIPLAGLPPARKAEIVLEFIMKHFNELRESFSVITRTGIRIRHQGK